MSRGVNPGQVVKYDFKESAGERETSVPKALAGRRRGGGAVGKEQEVGADGERRRGENETKEGGCVRERKVPWGT